MWIVCAYFTPGYKKHIKRLKNSLVQFNVPHDITPIEDKGDWYANTQYKPVFLKQMLKKHHPNSVVYVDADAVFLKYPKLFDKLDSKSKVNIAVHILDHSKYRRSNHPPEILSGTIFLRNSKECSIIISKWEEVIGNDPRMWDQVALSKVLRGYVPPFHHVLPEEYVTIYDYMSSVKNPVIKHFQASRESRRNIKHRVPKRLVKRGNIRRKNIH